MTKTTALERLTKVTDVWTPRLVIAVIVAAFTLSYIALFQLATEAGYHWSLAWLWPLVMDGVIVVTSLSLVKRQMRGDKTGYVWILLLLFDGASVFLNGTIGYTAETVDLIKWTFALVHALPPLTLLLIMKLYTNDIKDDSRHAEAVQTLADLAAQTETERATLADLTVKNADLAAKQDALETEIKALQKTRRESKKDIQEDRSAPATTGDEVKETAYQYLVNAHNEGVEPSGAALGRYLDRSESLGRRLKREFWPEIVNSQNGTNGHNQ